MGLAQRSDIPTHFKDIKFFSEDYGLYDGAYQTPAGYGNTENQLKGDIWFEKTK